MSGAAPPFILLAITAAIMVGLLSLLWSASSRPGLLNAIKLPTILYMIIATILLGANLFRIVFKEVAGASASVDFWRGWDIGLEIFTGVALSFGPLLSVLLLRYFQESEIPTPP